MAGEWPPELVLLVAGCTYRPGWRVALEQVPEPVAGLTCPTGPCLAVYTATVDAQDPSRPHNARHLFPVPPLPYSRSAWQRWLLERLIDVERHEAMEFLRIDGAQPYVPEHQAGVDLYVVAERVAVH